MANSIETCEALPALPSDAIQNATHEPYYPMGDHEGYSLSVCALPSPSLRERIQEVTDKLQIRFPEHHYAPADYLHMSIANLGIVATIQEVERTHMELREDLLTITASIQPIKVLVEGVNDFGYCFFAEVFSDDYFCEDDSLTQLHSQIAGIAKGIAQPSYLPHFTMGYPKDPAYKLYAHLLEHYRNWRFGEDAIDTLCVTALDTKLSLDQQPFKILAEYPLRG